MISQPETSALLFTLSLGFSVAMLVGSTIDKFSFKKFSSETQLSQESIATSTALWAVLVSFPVIWFLPPFFAGILAALVGSVSVIIQAVMEPAESGMWSHPRKRSALLISLPIAALPLISFIPDPSYIPLVYVSIICHRHKRNLRSCLCANLEAIEMLRFKVLVNKSALELAKLKESRHPAPLPVDHSKTSEKRAS